MRRRKFRLSSVLRVRQRQLDLAKAEVARLRGQQESEQREGERMRAGAVHVMEEILDRLTTGASGALLRNMDLAVDARRAAALAATRRADALEAPLVAARDAVVEAKRRVRGLELLEEKSRRLARVEQLRGETRALDEVGARRREGELS